MRTWLIVALMLAFVAVVSVVAAQQAAQTSVPKYDSRKEATFTGTVVDVKDHICPVSGGMGSHLTLKLKDGNTIEVHLATTKFVKTYELAFHQGDQVEVVGSKVKFEGVDTIFAREARRGEETFTFRDPQGKPLW